jgi:hypothetical protein
LHTDKNKPVPDGKIGKDPSGTPVMTFKNLKPGKYTPKYGIAFTAGKPNEVI